MKPSKNFDYKTIAKKLKKFGYKVNIKSAAGKKAAWNKWKKVGGYINYTEKPRQTRPAVAGKIYHLKKDKLPPVKSYKFKFQKLTPKQLKTLKKSGLYSKDQFSETGVFIEVPANLDRRKFRLKIKGNDIEILGGSRKDLMVRLDPEKMIVDPESAVTDAVKQTTKRKKKKPKGYSLRVRGYSAKNAQYTTLKQMAQYIKFRLLPDWLERNEDADEKKFADIFHVKILY